MEMKKAIKKKFPYRAALVACKGCKTDEKNTCTYGCIGCGKCVEVCKFDAISIGKDKIAIVDEEKCIACGRCVRECPQGIIHIHNCANYIAVKCANKQKGKEAREVCDTSCIGCGLCEKICTAQAVKVVENCAVIDEELCLSCGMCAVKCLRKAISDLRGILTN